MKKYMKFGLAHPKTIALLVLAGAMTLPLQGCNDELEAADESGGGDTRKLVEDYRASTMAEIIAGGRLYDNWISETDAAPPATRNKLNKYSTAESSAVNGTGTAALDAMTDGKDYRCKTCHSFSYQGNEDFAFGGVLDASDKYSVEELEILLTDGISSMIGGVATETTHDFGTYLSAGEITALAKFIKFGVVDTADYIWPLGKGIGRGDMGNGEALYKGATAGCSSCHGAKGLTIDFDDGDVTTLVDNEFVGTIGQNDPAEMLHKIRFGHAGDDVMRIGYNSGLTTQEMVDIMTYTHMLDCDTTKAIC